MKVTSLTHIEEIQGTTRKEAFLKANKWIAINIMNKDLNVQWKVIKSGEDSVRIEVYSIVDLKDVFNSKCNACQSFHTKFYINQQFNCDKCNATALVGSLKDKLKTINQYNKEKLNT